MNTLTRAKIDILRNKDENVDENVTQGSCILASNVRFSMTSHILHIPELLIGAITTTVVIQGACSYELTNFKTFLGLFKTRNWKIQGLLFNILFKTVKKEPPCVTYNFRSIMQQ